ncbi:MAG TPA: DUF3363 domain-containing protein [Sphingomicrobium sp.]
MDADRIVSTADPDPLQQGLRAGRLQTLQTLGLSEDLGGGQWRLVENIEETLRQVGEKGDIIRTMQRELSAQRLDPLGVGQRIYDPADGQVRPLVGKLLHRGLADELHDRHYLLIDGIDGEVHYVPVGRGDNVGPIPENSVVRITPTTVSLREADRTVDAVARANNGIYSIDAHLRHDPNASQAFAETHVRRLEALRRRGDVAERLPDGNWRIADDHLARVEAHERRVARDRPVDVDLLSPIAVERLPHLHAATWIDRRLSDEQPEPARDAGFGREVREAEGRRRQWLVEQELAIERDGDLHMSRNSLEQLRRRELLRVAGRLSGELGKPFEAVREGQRIEGVLKRSVDMVSGRHALIERAHDFTLVPWRTTLDRQIGKPVSGIVRDTGISWTIGRDRGGPAIS